MLTTPLKHRILFVCATNAVHSQMAEALLRNLRPDYEVSSAGTKPTDLDPQVLKILKRVDISAKGLYCKSLEKFEDEYFDYMVALDRGVIKKCRSLCNAGEFLTWSFDDSELSGGIEAYSKTLEEIRTHLKMFLFDIEKLQ